MNNKYFIVILLKDGTQVIDGCYLTDKDMEKYIEKRLNVFKNMLVSDTFAIGSDQIKMMFFKDAGIITDKEGNVQ